MAVNNSHIMGNWTKIVTFVLSKDKKLNDKAYPLFIESLEEEGKKRQEKVLEELPYLIAVELAREMNEKPFSFELLDKCVGKVKKQIKNGEKGN